MMPFHYIMDPPLPVLHFAFSKGEIWKIVFHYRNMIFGIIPKFVPILKDALFFLVILIVYQQDLLLLITVLYLLLAAG